MHDLTQDRRSSAEDFIGICPFPTGCMQLRFVLSEPESDRASKHGNFSNEH